MEVPVRGRRWVGGTIGAILAVVVAWWGLRPSTGIPDGDPAPVEAAPAPASRRRVPAVGPRPAGGGADRAPPAAPRREEPVAVDRSAAGPGEGLGRLDLRVRDTRGDPVDAARIVLSGDCGPRRLRLSGGEGEIDVAPGSCRVRALRRDGALPTWSAPVEVAVAPGRVVPVDVELPAARTGGLGVRIAPHEDGVRVEAVLPGSPADAAGLVAGDVIVEVDGIPAASLSLAAFQEAMTGPEGTRVDFVLACGADTGCVEAPIEIVRAFLDG